MANERFILVVVLSIVLCAFVTVSFAQNSLEYQDQVPTGADNGPQGNLSVSCVEHKDVNDKRTYLACMAKNVDDVSDTGFNSFFVTLYNYALNRWVAKIPLTIGYGGSVVAFGIVGDTVYAIQRDNCETFLALNLTTGQQTNLTVTGWPAEVCRNQDSVTFTYNNRLYILAGIYMGFCSGNMYSVDVTKTDGPPAFEQTIYAPTAANYTRCDMAVTVVGDTLYAYGGNKRVDLPGRPPSERINVGSASFDQFDFKSRVWTNINTGPIVMIQGTLIYDQPKQRFLILGGSNDTLLINIIYETHEYRPANPANGWVNIAASGGDELRSKLETDPEIIPNVFLGLYRNKDGFFALGSADYSFNRRRDPETMEYIITRNDPEAVGRALERQRKRREESLALHSHSRRDTTGNAIEDAPIGFIFNERPGAPYFSFPAENLASSLYMNDRNGVGVLEPAPGADVSLQIGFASFTECDSTGEPLTSEGAKADFPVDSYTISDTRTQGEVQVYSFGHVLDVRGENVTLELELSFFEDAKDVTHAGVTYPLAPDQYKSTIALQQWPFLSPSNTLLLHIDLTPTEDRDLVSRKIVEDTVGYVVAEYKWKDLKSRVRLLKFVEVNGAPVPVLRYEFKDDAVEVLFASYDGVLEYDPDIGATIDANDGGDGSDDKIVYLAFLSVLALIPIVIVVIVVVAIAFLVIKFYVKGGSGGDNFDVDL